MDPSLGANLTSDQVLVRPGIEAAGRIEKQDVVVPWQGLLCFIQTEELSVYIPSVSDSVHKSLQWVHFISWC